MQLLIIVIMLKIILFIEYFLYFYLFIPVQLKYITQQHQLLLVHLIIIHLHTFNFICFLNLKLNTFLFIACNLFLHTVFFLLFIDSLFRFNNLFVSFIYFKYIFVKGNNVMLQKEYDYVCRLLQTFIVLNYIIILPCLKILYFFIQLY